MENFAATSLIQVLFPANLKKSHLLIEVYYTSNQGFTLKKIVHGFLLMTLEFHHVNHFWDNTVISQSLI
jgi:hypothetical protein